MDRIAELLSAIGLASASEDAIALRVSGDGDESDELGFIAAGLPPASVDELCDALLEGGGAASLPAVSAACNVGEREILALVLALQQRGGALALAAFRLHLATAYRGRLHPLVLVGFVRGCRALNTLPGGADAGAAAAPPSGALEAVLGELLGALRTGERLAADAAQSVAEAASEALRSGRLREQGGEQRAFDLLGCLLPEHAQPVFRTLVPMLALTLDGASAAAVSRDAAALQRMACAFACDALAAGGDDPQVLTSALALVQHAMASAPDKADFRAAVSKAASTIVACMPDEHACRFVSFACRLSRNAKPQQRAMACEAALEALLAPGLAHVPGEPLADLLLAATRDKSTSVRSRAVHALSTLVERGAGAECGAHGRALLSMLDGRAGLVVGAAGEDSQPGAQPAEGSPLLLQLVERSSPGGAAPPPGPAAPPARTGRLAALLAARCRDSKPVVRRVAVVALSCLALASGDAAADAETLGALGARCRDTSVAVRRAAAAALAAQLEAAAEAAAPAGSEAADAVCHAWLAAVAPLAADAEPSMREQATAALCAALLQPLAHGPPARAALGWRALGGCNHATTEHLRRACARLAAGPAGGLPRGHGRALQAALGARASPDGEPLSLQARSAGWSLLAELAASKPHAKELHAAELAAAWTAPSGGAPRRAPDDVDGVGGLQVAVWLCRHAVLPRADADALRGALRARLLGEEASPQLARAVAHAYAATVAVAGASAAEAWREIVGRCEEVICARAGATPRARPADGVGGSTPEACAPAPAVEPVLACVFLVGEIGLLCAGEGGGGPDPLPERLLRALEAEAVPRRAGGRPLFTADSPALRADAERAALQAQAIVALGKLAGSRPALGRRLMPMLVSELHGSCCAAVRNNCLFVLADLLTSCTALVDRHVPLLALAAADSEPLVRFHCVVLLTRLLLSEYVRAKPVLLRALALCLADPEERVASVASHCLLETLLPRQPHALANGLVELSAHLNGCGAHAAFSRAGGLCAAQEARLQLPGAANRQRRATIYCALASALPDEAKLSAAHKMLSEVLGPVADGSLPLAERGAAEMLADALVLLASGALRVAPARGGGAADADDAALDELAAAAAGADGGGGGGGAAARASGARAKVVLAASARLSAEGALPVAVELRRVLEACRSPLLGLLMAFVRELVRHSKELLAELVQRDAEFAAEVQFDLGRQPARARAAAAEEGALVLAAERGGATAEPPAAAPAGRAHANPARRRATLEENRTRNEANTEPARQAAAGSKRARKGRSVRTQAETPEREGASVA